MIQLRKYDKIIIVIGLLIVIGLFVLAYVLAFKGGQCAINPAQYMRSQNMTIPIDLYVSNK